MTKRLLIIFSLMLLPYMAMADSVVVKVGNNIVTSYDVDARSKMLLVFYNQTINDDNLNQVKQAAISQLINDQVKIITAMKNNVSLSQADLTSGVADIAKQNNMTSDQFLSGLTGQGVSQSAILFKIKADLMWNKYLSTQAYKINITDDQVNSAYNKIIASKEVSKNLIQISFPFGDAASMQKAASDANSLYQKLQTAKDVNALISTLPADSVSKLGWMIAGELPDAMASIVSPLQAGQFSTASKSDQAYVIFYVAGAKQYQPTKDEVRQNIFMQQINNLSDTLMISAKQNIYIQIM